jgi:hypothetical protein
MNRSDRCLLVANQGPQPSFFWLGVAERAASDKFAWFFGVDYAGELMDAVLLCTLCQTIVGIIHLLKGLQ